MPTETANYGFTKDNEDEFYNVNVVNDNLDKIDTEMKRIEDVSKNFNEQIADNTNAIVNSNTKLDTHIKDDEGHTRWFGNATGTNAKTIITTKPLPIDSNGDPINGASFRFMNSTTNTGAVTMFVTHANGTTKTYPVYNNGNQLKAGDLPSTTVHTVTFAGGSFHLQGKGGDMVSGAQSSQQYNTPGTFSFTVPDGVTRIVAYLWGGGGGGGGAQTFAKYSGGGGGGGAFRKAILQVTPKSKLDITVGKGGVGGIAYAGSVSGAPNGDYGGYSSVSGPLNGIARVYGGGYGEGGQLTRGGNGGTGANKDGFGAGGFVSNDTAFRNGAIEITALSEISKTILTINGATGSHAVGSSAYGGGGAGGPSDVGIPTYGGGGGYHYNNGTFNGYSIYGGGTGGIGSATTKAAQNASRGGGGGGGNFQSNETNSGGNGGDGMVVLVW